MGREFNPRSTCSALQSQEAVTYYLKSRPKLATVVSPGGIPHHNPCHISPVLQKANQMNQAAFLLNEQLRRSPCKDKYNCLLSSKARRRQLLTFHVSSCCLLALSDWTIWMRAWRFADGHNTLALSTVQRWDIVPDIGRISRDDFRRTAFLSSPYNKTNIWGQNIWRTVDYVLD